MFSDLWIAFRKNVDIGELNVSVYSQQFFLCMHKICSSKPEVKYFLIWILLFLQCVKQGTIIWQQGTKYGLLRTTSTKKRQEFLWRTVLRMQIFVPCIKKPRQIHGEI
jgi:tryptophan-rich sensory protein